MLTQEQLERFSSYAENVLEKHVDRGEDMGPVVGIFKDDVPYVWIFPTITRGAEDILEVAIPSIIGMEPDYILIANDTYHIDYEQHQDLVTVEVEGRMEFLKPSDGKPWGPGDLEYAVKNNTEDAKYVTDALFVQYHDRLGEVTAMTRPYKIVDHKVDWGERFKTDGMMGFVVQTIQHAFQQPTLRDRLKAEAEIEQDISSDIAGEFDWLARFAMADVGVSPTAALEWCNEHPDEAYACMICEVIKMALAPTGCAIALGVHSPEVLEVFRTSLGLGDLNEPEEGSEEPV